MPIAGPISYDERTRPRSHIAMAFSRRSISGDRSACSSASTANEFLQNGTRRRWSAAGGFGSNSGLGLEGDVAKHFLSSKLGRDGISKLAMLPGGRSMKTMTVPIACRFSEHPLKHQISPSPLGSMHGTSVNGTAAGILIAQQILRRNTRMGCHLRPGPQGSKGFNKGGDSDSIVHGLDDIEPGGGAVMKSRSGENCRIEGGDGVPNAVCIMHAQGLHSDVEQCRPNVELSLPRFHHLRHRW